MRFTDMTTRSEVTALLFAALIISSPYAEVSAGTLFWGQVGNGQIVRGETDGTNVQTLVDAPIIRPRALALDLTNRKIYWVESGLATVRLGRIQRSDFDGSNIEDLIVTDDVLDG